MDNSKFALLGFECHISSMTGERVRLSWKKKDKNNKINRINGVNWYNLCDEDIKICCYEIAVPRNTSLLDPVVSHLIKKNNNKDEVDTQHKSLDMKSYD